MGAGTLAMACLCAVLGQAPSDVVHTNQKSLRIPINFQDSRRSELRELLLFASWDQGRNWQQVAAILPDKNEFTFNAASDGTCWLRVAVVNRQGKQEPDNIQQGPPDQKLVIDTTKPVMKTLSAQRQGEEVGVNWEILEDHPDWQHFRLEYQPRDNPGAFWSVIQATPGPTGQARFRPTSSGPLTVRLLAKDLAGNSSFNTTDVPGLPGAPSVAAASGAPGTSGAPTINMVGGSLAAPPAAGGVVSAVPPPPLTTPSHSPSTANAFGSSPPVPPPLDPKHTSNSPPPPPPPATPWAPLGGAISAAPPGITAKPADSLPPPPPMVDPNIKPIATSETTPQGSLPLPGAANPVAAAAPRKQMPPLQYVNHPELMLEYELSKVGPSGVGSVDLWWTQNDGQSWELYAVDPEVKGTTKSGRYQRTVELPGDGIYGFILVVKSRAGLGKAPPRAGDPPDIRVEVDSVSPLAHLYSPIPEPQRANTLLLKWAAKDNNLTTNPVTLEWSEKREGPWYPIATNIANTGRHAWHLPDTLPVQVYMRLRVRDCAGNESVAITPEPQLVDLSEPEGRLLNVSVTPRRP